jgi:hypothetical protein
MSFEKAVQDEIKRLKDRIAALASVVGIGNAPRKASGASRKATARKAKTTRKPKRKVSPKVRAMRVLQGQYMGHVRLLTAEQKKKVGTIREKSGYRRAIAEAKRMGKAR